MTKSKAIKQFCIECSGDSLLTATLCCSFDCPLWTWRLGVAIKTKEYRLRLESAIHNHPEYLKDLSEIGADINRFSLKQPIPSHRKEERASACQTTGAQE